MAARKHSAAEPVWKHSAPPGTQHGHLTAKQKAGAKARAKRAGRPYPNAVDNIRAAAKKR